MPVLNCFARLMHFSSTSSCSLKPKLAPKLSFLGLYGERGAPGQSVLKSGLAMSVTRSLYLSRMALALAMSASSSVEMFLPHMERNSTHSRPKSLAITEQAWSKSGEISSLITATRNVDFNLAAITDKGNVFAAAAAPVALRKVRRETSGIRGSCGLKRSGRAIIRTQLRACGTGFS